jgi:hypothetical protein
MVEIAFSFGTPTEEDEKLDLWRHALYKDSQKPVRGGIGREAVQSVEDWTDAPSNSLKRGPDPIPVEEQNDLAGWKACPISAGRGRARESV